jgi:hypothetical protein
MVLAVLSDDGRNMFTLDGFLLLVYVLRGVTVPDVSYEDCFNFQNSV